MGDVAIAKSTTAATRMVAVVQNSLRGPKGPKKQATAITAIQKTSGPYSPPPKATKGLPVVVTPSQTRQRRGSSSLAATPPGTKRKVAPKDAAAASSKEQRKKKPKITAATERLDLLRQEPTASSANGIRPVAMDMDSPLASATTDGHQGLPPQTAETNVVRIRTLETSAFVILGRGAKPTEAERMLEDHKVWLENDNTREHPFLEPLRKNLKKEGWLRWDQEGGGTKPRHSEKEKELALSMEDALDCAKFKGHESRSTGPRKHLATAWGVTFRTLINWRKHGQIKESATLLVDEAPTDRLRGTFRSQSEPSLATATVVRTIPPQQPLRPQNGARAHTHHQELPNATGTESKLSSTHNSGTKRPTASSATAVRLGSKKAHVSKIPRLNKQQQQQQPPAIAMTHERHVSAASAASAATTMKATAIAVTGNNLKALLLAIKKMVFQKEEEAGRKPKKYTDVEKLLKKHSDWIGKRLKEENPDEHPFDLPFRENQSDKGWLRRKGRAQFGSAAEGYCSEIEKVFALLMEDALTEVPCLLIGGKPKHCVSREGLANAWGTTCQSLTSWRSQLEEKGTLARKERVIGPIFPTRSTHLTTALSPESSLTVTRNNGRPPCLDQEAKKENLIEALKTWREGEKYRKERALYKKLGRKYYDRDSVQAKLLFTAIFYQKRGQKLRCQFMKDYKLNPFKDAQSFLSGNHLFEKSSIAFMGDQSELVDVAFNLVDKACKPGTLPYWMAKELFGCWYQEAAVVYYLQGTYGESLGRPTKGCDTGCASALVGRPAFVWDRRSCQIVAVRIDATCRIRPLRVTILALTGTDSRFRQQGMNKRLINHFLKFNHDNRPDIVVLQNTAEYTENSREGGYYQKHGFEGMPPFNGFLYGGNDRFKCEFQGMTKEGKHFLAKRVFWEKYAAVIASHACANEELKLLNLKYTSS